MKRFMTVGVLALAILGMSQQQASAWKKFGFNIGLGINTESADNSYLWGAFRNGPVPGSKGHGLASTITKSSHPHYPEYHGGGFNPHYGPGDFGHPIVPVAPIVLDHTLPGGHVAPAPLPAALPAPLPAPLPVPLPAPATPHTLAPAPTFTPAAYWVPAQSYYWPGN